MKTYVQSRWLSKPRQGRHGLGLAQASSLACVRITCFRIAGVSLVLTVVVGASSAFAQTPETTLSPTPSPTLSPTPDLSASYEGFTVAIDDVMIGSDEIGRIVELPIRLGQTVRRGDLLAKLDDTTQRASIAVAMVQSQSVGEIRAAESAVKVQRGRVEQLNTLSQQSMAGPEETRRAVADLEMAEARLLSAHEQQELRIAELERLKIQLRQREILAPFDGIVAQRILSVGATLSPTNQSILRLIRIDSLEAVFNIPAAQALLLQPEMPAQVYLRAARRTVDASVDSMSPAIDGESGTVQVRLRIANADQTLRPGDRCTMRLMGPTRQAAAATSLNPWGTFRQ